ncbi:MAG: D-sedoheptulose 7-phosphate isomerase [Flavobacteriales bacterium]|nr:D-sedoheptulose 7-phosphate isomerase [Flavobacteriales bacterium]
MNRMKSALEESIRLREQMLADTDLQALIAQAADAMVNTFQAEGKVLFCGNGGSAADAQHIAAELSGRFKKDRKPLFAEALHVNSSFVTAVANDYGYDEIYARMTEAMGRKGDVLVGLSTSGNSKNVVKAMQKAKELGMITVAFLGASDGAMASLADVAIRVPSTDTARIQELHITIGHVICEEIEAQLFA